jgi:hypothetical protein
MQRDESRAGPSGLSRRHFLAGGIRAGAGVAALGLGLGACGSGHDSSPLPAGRRHPATLAGGAHPDIVTEPPLQPVDHVDFVTRPDFHPVGVTVRSSAALATSGLQSQYIFCAPKTPLAANPGPLPPRAHPFPAGAQAGLMILDTNGELVWFRPLPGGHEIPFNFRVQTYKGKPTLTWFKGTVHGGHATGGTYVLADDSYREIAEVHATRYPSDLHEFILTPEGTALHTAYEDGVISPRGVSLVVGHALEVDVATNDLLFDWPSFPHVAPELSYTRRYGDYFHINSIALWPGPERNLLISSRNTCAVYLIERRTKRVIWRLGGKRSDFEMGPDTRFYFQHDARPLADGSGLSLFDDASQPCPEPYGSGKVLAMDGGKVTLAHRFLHTDHELNSSSQGNCQLLDNGGHVVGWGFVPLFSVYGPSGDTVEAPLILDGRFPLGSASYRSFLFDWVGHPHRRELRLVVRPTGGTGHFTAWVSWNGATQVTTWELRARTSTGALETLSRAPKRGFETAVSFARDGVREFEVAGLDASGRVLGVSDTVTAA